MTSKNKYLRRQAKRNRKKEKFLQTLGDYDKIFSWDNLYNSFLKCKRGVMWKSSIQNYEIFKASNTYNIFHLLNKRKYKSKGFTEFHIMERGKPRFIQSVHISERCVQKVLCDKYLTPIIGRYLIYDNGASVKNKGTSFAIDRIQAHLHKYYRKNQSNQGYILIYDFSNYFNSIDHNTLYKLIDDKFSDAELKHLFHHFINCFEQGGLGLGSQVSQIAAIFFATKIDLYFKQKLKVKEYGRYMDDGYAIFKTKEEANFAKNKIKELAAQLKLSINDKKIQIRKLGSNFCFLKKQFSLSETGHVYKKLCRKSIVTERRKLKKLAKKMDIEKIIAYPQFRTSYVSWRSNAIRYDNYWAIKSMDKLYNELLWKYYSYN